MKKLIPTVALALMGAAAVTGSTYAWFSMNKTVEATGMKVKATTSGALVIGTSVSQINKVTVNLGDTSANVLSHSTHCDVDEDYPNGLKTITDSSDVVDPISGAVEEATWRSAENGSAVDYFVDYEVFIASAGAAMENTTIEMSMNDEMKKEVQQNWAINSSAKTIGFTDTLFGFTVDVYAGGLVDATDYTSEDFEPEYEHVGTYHLDDTSAVLDLDVSEIPTTVNGDGEAQGLVFLLRVYLDGEYGKNTVTMQPTSDGTAKAGKAYFTEAAGVYTVSDVDVGGNVSGLYEVGALGTRSSTDKYVHTEKANTSDLNLGFEFEAKDLA